MTPGADEGEDASPGAGGGPGRAGRRPLRVLVAHPSAELYGSDRMLLESVTGLVADGDEVVVALPVDGPLRARLEGAGARVVRCASPVLRKSALRPAGALRLGAEAVAGLVRGAALVRRARPDVLYVSTQVLPLWPLLGRALGVPVVAHVHEAESRAAPVLQRALAAPLVLARPLLVNSAYAGAVLAAALPRLRGRADVVPNGVAGPPGPVLPARRSGPARLLYVGRLSERKGVLVAVAAVAELVRRGHDVRLDLLGDVVEGSDFRATLAAALDEPLLAGRVERHGFQADVWPHLAGSDLLLVPSLLPEPFGNTAVEGVLAGRPVVASATGGLPEALAGCRSAALVPAGDAGALADAVEEVLHRHAEFAGRAVEDAELLRERHDPARYRAAVAASARAAVAASARAAARAPGDGRSRRRGAA